MLFLIIFAGCYEFFSYLCKLEIIIFRLKRLNFIYEKENLNP
jgi:hypothetical protein